MDEPEVTREELEKAVSKLRNRKSAGDDCGRAAKEWQRGND